MIRRTTEYDTGGQPRVRGDPADRPMDLRRLGGRSAQRHPLDQLHHLRWQPSTAPVGPIQAAQAVKAVRLVGRTSTTCTRTAVRIRPDLTRPRLLAGDRGALRLGLQTLPTT